MNIVFDNVTYRYHYDNFDVLKNASFNLVNGVNTVLADIQSGKTTICKLLCKDISATSGQITIDEVSIASITDEHLGILYLPQNPTFFERRSVQYNIEYPLFLRKVPKDVRFKRVNEVANALGIDFLSTQPFKLTSYERRIVALARGLTVQRKAVLFDDFFDVEEQYADVQSVTRLFPDATVVVFTSNVNIAMGNVVVLDGGAVAFCGDASGAKQAVGNLQWLTDSLRSN